MISSPRSPACCAAESGSIIWSSRPPASPTRWRSPSPWCARNFATAFVSMRSWHLDAEAFSLERFAGGVALNQLRYADFVLLNKCDLASSSRIAAVEDRIRGVAQGARILRATRAAVALPLILGTGLFRSDRLPLNTSHDHIAEDGFDAVSFASDRALSADAFQAFLERLPANVFRAKGILTIAGSCRRHVFHLVGRRFTLDEAPAGVSGQTRLALIGQNLDARYLRAQLAACLAPGVIPAGP